MRILSLITLTILSTAILSAANYYCSPSGSGSSGTLSSPCSYATGIGKLTSGDTLFVRGGQYNFTAQQRLTKSGNSTARVVICAYKDEVPVFDFRKQIYNSNNRGIRIDGSWVVFKGIIIQYAGDNGLYMEGSNNIIENCIFRYNCDTGCQLKVGSNNLVKNCDSYGNFDYKTTSSSSADYGGNADGFSDKQYPEPTAIPQASASGNTYEGCRSWNNSDDGWDFYQLKSNNQVIKNSICYNNGVSSYDMRNHARYDIDKTWFDSLSGGTTADAAWLATYPNYGNGNGFKLGGDYRENNCTLYNCVSVGHKSKGFDQNNNAGKMVMYNCTAINNNRNFGFGDKSTDNSSATNKNSSSPAAKAYVDIKNSISYKSTQSNQFPSSSNLSTSNNSWNTTGVSTPSTSDFQSLDETLLTAPRLANGELPTALYAKLTQNSSMRNKGINVGLPFIGSKPDLGWNPFENPLNVFNTKKKDSPIKSSNYFTINGKKIISPIANVVVIKQNIHEDGNISIEKILTKY